MSKIIYLCLSFPVVSETFISDQVKALVANGTDVSVLALAPGSNTQLTNQWQSNALWMAALTTLYSSRTVGWAARAGALVASLNVLLHPFSWAMTFRIARKDPWILAQALHYASWLRKHPQTGSLLICHFGPIGYIGALLRAWGYLDMPQITVFHGYDVSRVVRQKGCGWYRALLKSPGHSSVAITKLWQERLSKMGDPAATWIPLGVDTDAIGYCPRSYPHDRPVKLITVGRLTGKKGQADVVTALSMLPSEFTSTWEYHLVGAGPEERNLKALVEKLSLTASVIFHGALPHNSTMKLLNEADVFVLTSRTDKDGDMEGLPVALMEALANGMPTISTYHSGIPELITHNQTGLLGDEGDVVAIKDNITKILRDPDLWETLATAGRRKVEKDYNATTNFGIWQAFVDARKLQPALKYDSLPG